MKWTKTLPDQPGFYFMRWQRGKRRVVEVWGSQVPYIFVRGAGVNCSLTRVKPTTEWAGPIPEPEEPEDE